MSRYYWDSENQVKVLISGQDDGYVAESIAPIESSPSTKSYEVGKRLYYQGNLYEVISPISIGDTLDSSLSGNIKVSGLLSDMLTSPDSTPTSGSTNSVQSGGVYSALENKTSKVFNATNGNFAGLDSSGNLTDSGSSASDFLSSRYLETSVKTTADGKDTFTFTDSAITPTSSFDVYSDVFAAPVVDMVLSGTQLDISYNSSDNVGTCRLYIK